MYTNEEESKAMLQWDTALKRCFTFFFFLKNAYPDVMHFMSWAAVSKGRSAFSKDNMKTNCQKMKTKWWKEECGVMIENNIWPWKHAQQVWNVTDDVKLAHVSDSTIIWVKWLRFLYFKQSVNYRVCGTIHYMFDHFKRKSDLYILAAYDAHLNLILCILCHLFWDELKWSHHNQLCD